MTVLASLTALLTLSAVFYRAVTAANHPICIVGAGPGGLTIAHELEARGFQTVVFDKQAEVGGKCQAYYEEANENVYHPLGALLFTNHTYFNTVSLVEAAGLPLTPGMSIQKDREYRQYGHGPSAKDVQKMPAVSKIQVAIIAVEYARYVAYWTQKFAPMYTSIRYTHGVPEDLTVPMKDWLSAHGFRALQTVMSGGMVPYGYGSIAETPAIYMLQYYTPDILGVFLGIVESYIVDFHQVFVHYSASIEGRVYVNAPVTRIDRSTSTPKVTYNTSGLTFTQPCSDVILAFAPTMSNLGQIDMPLTPSEVDVFSKVVVTSYWSSATTTQLEYLHTYIQTPPVPLGAPVGILRVFPDSPVTIAYSWGPTDRELSTEEATALLIQTLSDVHTGAGLLDSEPVAVTEKDVKAIRKWDYFPHFMSGDLADGVYERYAALQGQRNTYYSSGLNGLETVEFAIRAGKELVEAFFPHKSSQPEVWSAEVGETGERVLSILDIV